ncbi:Thioredoxin domain [Trypanosoma melophagium]|uniref:Thioredoxin domain n=1 Tax=Trypanosoma melophagium TaxID=715481 RepID=UPI00351A3E8C|nr:Thioredoxin domain [Trypanosoma melophagium]
MNERNPKVSVGVIHHAPSCTEDQRVKFNSHVTVDLQLFTDRGKKNRKEVLKKEDKVIRNVGHGLSLLGLEYGIIGACVGETRSIRIPAELGFGPDGNEKLKVPEDTPLRAIVVIKSSRMAAQEELDKDPFSGDEDFEDNTEATLPFPPPIVEVSDDDFEEKVKGKHALFFLYASWSDKSKEFQPEFIRVAGAFAGESDVVLVATDAGVNHQLADKFDVDAYPKISLLKATGEIIPYNNEMTALRVTMFLNRELKKSVPLP